MSYGSTTIGTSSLMSAIRPTVSLKVVLAPCSVAICYLCVLAPRGSSNLLRLSLTQSEKIGVSVLAVALANGFLYDLDLLVNGWAANRLRSSRRRYADRSLLLSLLA